MPTAKVIADSVNPHGQRLTTLVVKMPKCIQAEFNTHRMFSRNSASSRAIGFAKIVERVEKDPYIPEWTREQRGMSGELNPCQQECTERWLLARDAAIHHAKQLRYLYEVHKQDVNRLLEPWMHVDVIVSSTEWENFYRQRCHPDAHPAMQKLAFAMQDAIERSDPDFLEWNQWHLPFKADEYPLEQARIMSVARCAWVSYSNHERDASFEAAMKTVEKLVTNGHRSPFEHVAVASAESNQSGNFRNGWVQLREIVFDKGNCPLPV